MKKFFRQTSSLWRIVIFVLSPLVFLYPFNVIFGTKFWYELPVFGWCVALALIGCSTLYFAISATLMICYHLEKKAWLTESLVTDGTLTDGESYNLLNTLLGELWQEAIDKWESGDEDKSVVIFQIIFWTAFTGLVGAIYFGLYMVILFIQI